MFIGVTVPRPELVRAPNDVGLAFDEQTFAGDDGVTLSAWRIPAARPIGTVALFHGYAQAKDSLLEAAIEFHALGYTCYLLDFRGSGGSSEDYTTLGIREAADVRAVVDAIEPEGPLVLYGVSMGSAAILRAVAHERVRADALIVDAPFDRMLTTVRNRFEAMDVPALPSFPLAELLVYWGGRQLEFDGFAHEPVVYAASVTIPTLILSGADDPYAQRDEVGAVFQALAGRKQIREFPGVAHEQIAVVRPAEFREVTAVFLAGVGDR